MEAQKSTESFDHIEAAHLEVRTEEEWDALAGAANRAIRANNPDAQIDTVEAFNDAYVSLAGGLTPFLEGLGIQVGEGHETGSVLRLGDEEIFPFAGPESAPVARGFAEVMDQYRNALAAA